MRKIYLIPAVLFSAAVLFVSCSPTNVSGKFSITPDKPEAGQTVDVVFKADSTKLAGVDSVGMTVYQYGVKPIKTVEVNLTKKDGAWTGEFETTDSTRGALIKFSGKDASDNNNNEGYVVKIYDKNGEPVPGCMAGLGDAINSWAPYYLDLDKNKNLAEKYFNEDFKKHPEIKNDYLDAYLNLETGMYKDKADSIVKSELNPVESLKSKSEKEISLLAKWYSRINDKTKADEYTDILKKDYPQDDFLQMQAYSALSREKDLAKKLGMANSFEKEFPGSRYLTNLYNGVVSGLISDGKYTKAQDVLYKKKGLVHPYYFYKDATNMMNKPGMIKSALKLSEAGVAAAQSEVDNPTGKQPELSTPKEWKKEREYYLGMNLYGEGIILSKMGKNSEAEPLLEKAVALTQGEESDITEAYGKALLANGKYDKLMSTLEGYIKTGKGTEEMTSLLRDSYVKKNGNDKGFSDLLAKYQGAAKTKMLEDIKSKMINEPAPDFKVTDLNGKEVSLKDYRGKVVVLDFWATWCGPCKSSFPGMKEVVDKYSKDNNVQFLFVNSWERVKDKKSNAEEFIKKNNYPFHVLLDENNSVIEKYGVSGIPTKFFIDKNGEIRFKSIGFSGNTDQMVEEISAVISMISKS